MKTLLIAASAALLLPPAIPAGAAGAEAMAERPMRFQLQPADGGRVHFQLSMSGPDGRGGNYGRTMAPAEFDGLGADGSAAGFRLVREAGTLDCEGQVEALRGSGTCRFLPDPAFAAELERRGIGRPGVDEQFHLAMAEAGRPLLDELARQHYPAPNLQQFVAMAIHGVSRDYVHAIDEAGYRRPDVDALIGFRIHGITPAYIAGLRGIGPRFASLSAEEVMSLRIHGVTAAYARDMAEAGLRDLSPEQLIALRIHAVRPEHARAAAAETDGSAATRP